MFSLSMFGTHSRFGLSTFSLLTFGPIRCSVFRCSVPFEVRSFDVQSHSIFGLSTFGLSRFSLSRFGLSRFGHSRFGHGFYDFILFYGLNKMSSFTSIVSTTWYSMNRSKPSQRMEFLLYRMLNIFTHVLFCFLIGSDQHRTARGGPILAKWWREKVPWDIDQQDLGKLAPVKYITESLGNTMLSSSIRSRYLKKKARCRLLRVMPTKLVRPESNQCAKYNTLLKSQSKNAPLGVFSVCTEKASEYTRTIKKLTTGRLCAFITILPAIINYNPSSLMVSQYWDFMLHFLPRSLDILLAYRTETWGKHLLFAQIPEDVFAFSNVHNMFHFVYWISFFYRTNWEVTCSVCIIGNFFTHLWHFLLTWFKLSEIPKII